MERGELIARLCNQAGKLRSGGAVTLFLFGSRARGDNHPGSDVDAFIDIDPGRKFSLLDLIGLEHAIERKTGLQVDLTTRSSLHPALRESIEAEAIRIF